MVEDVRGGPFCEHMLDGGAYDLAKDIRRRLRPVIEDGLAEHMKRQRAVAIAEVLCIDLQTAVCEVLAEGYAE